MKDFEKLPKNKWVQLIRKKWFLPALYLTIAGLILSAVVWYQMIGNPWFNSSDMRDQVEQAGESVASDFDHEAQSVLQQEERIKMPIDEALEAEIVTKFYDYDGTAEEQEKGVTFYNNRYYQSTGIDITQANGEEFEVLASLSGTVTEVKEDPLLGHIVTISHSDSITTHYASLGEVVVDAGEKVKQGEKIGSAGKNIFNESSGRHVHFEIHKDGIEVNPETFINEAVSKLEQLDIEAAELEESQEGSKEESKEEPKEKKPEPNEEVSFSITT